MTAPVVDTRKDNNRQQLTVLARWCATLLVAPAFLAALVVGLATQNLWLGLLAAVIVYVVVSLLAFRHVQRFGSGFVAGLAEGTVDEEAAARLGNLTEGLCIAHGVTRPEIKVLDADGLNAATVVLGEKDREVMLLVTRGLVEALSRIELEGLLAQQLSHIRDGDVALSTFVAAVSSVPLAGPLLARRVGSGLDPELETAADLAGAGMTRYPPGLAAALEKVGAGSNEVPGVVPTAAHLWIADPLPAGTPEPFVPHPPLVDRIEVLGEL